MAWLTTIFGQQGELDAWQACARAVLIFAYGLLLVRIAGRRVFGKWSALDIVLSIIIGSNLSRAMTGSAPLWGTLAATTVLVLLHWVLAHLAARLQPVSRLVEGSPIILARGGEMTRGERIRHSVSEADLAEALRQSGISRPEEAEQITLEPSGKITILKREA